MVDLIWKFEVHDEYRFWEAKLPPFRARVIQRFEGKEPRIEYMLFRDSSRKYGNTLIDGGAQPTPQQAREQAGQRLVELSQEQRFQIW